MSGKGEIVVSRDLQLSLTLVQAIFALLIISKTLTCVSVTGGRHR